MAKRTSVKKKAGAIPAHEAIEVVAPAPVIPAPAPKAPAGLPRRLLLVALLALGAWTFYLAFAKRGPAGTPLAPAAQVEWGPELKLEVLKKFPVPEDALDIKVDAQGNVYVLTATGLFKYSDGAKVKTLPLPGAGARSMAFDGKDFYVTDFGMEDVVRFGLDFSAKGVLHVTGAKRVLAIAFDRRDNSFLVSDVDAKHLYILDQAGRKTGVINGPQKADEGNGFVFDLQVDASGNIYESDGINRRIVIFSAARKQEKVIPFAWNAANRSRVAPLKDKVYMNCFNEERILVTNHAGEHLGHVKVDAPLMMTAGLDGFLYVLSAGKILQMAPLAPAAAAPSK